jgi:uncharacterized protein YdaU (DUF1376 family)
MAEWVNGPLPYDPERLAKICQMSSKRFDHNYKNVSPKFVQNSEGFLVNLRLEETRRKQSKYSESRSKVAHKRWDKTNAYALHTDMHTECPSSSSSKNINTLVISGANNDCPHQEIIALYHELLPMLPRVRQWTPKRQKHLRARWLSSKEYQDLDWWKQFFLFVATKCPHLTGKNDRQWTADLEWICGESNFVKILEGRYEK